MRWIRSYYPRLVIGAVVALSIGFVYGGGNTYRRTVLFTNEREIKATIEAGFAKLTIGAGKSNTILDADITSANSLNMSDCVDYSIRDKIGYLTVNTEENNGERKHGFNISNLESSSWNVTLTNAVPISFDIQLGLGKGDFDFTDLNVKDLSLSAGASSVKMRFNKPNKNIIEDLTIEAGLSKFESKGLGNARFRHL